MEVVVASKTSLEISLGIDTSAVKKDFAELEKNLKDAVARGGAEGISKSVGDALPAIKELRRLMNVFKPDTAEGIRVRASRRRLQRGVSSAFDELDTGTRATRNRDYQIAEEMKRMESNQKDEKAIRASFLKDAKLDEKGKQAMLSSQSSFLDSIAKRQATEYTEAWKDAIADDKRRSREKAEEARKLRKEDRTHIAGLREDTIREKAKERRLDKDWNMAIAEDKRRNAKNQRMGSKFDQIQSVKDLMMLNSLIAAGTQGLPGAGLIQSGVYGFTSAYSKAQFTRDPKTGQMIKAEDGAALFAGLKGGAGALGLAALAAGMFAGMTGDRAEESQSVTFGRAMGGRIGPGAAWRNRVFQGLPGKMKMEEGMPVALSALQATRGEGGVDAALRAQLMSGRGQEFAGLSGAMMTGGAFAKQEVDPAMAKAWTAIFASGVEQGFKNGDVAELIAGATSMANQQALGTVLSSDSTQRTMMMSNFLATNDAFKSKHGFEMMGNINTMISGHGSSGLGRALALRAAGLGEGKDYVEASMIAEQGLLGAGGKGLEQFKRTMETFDKMGLTGTARINAMREALGGGTWSGANNLLTTWDNPKARAKLDEKTYGKMLEDTKDVEQKAYEAMAKFGEWNTIEQDVQKIGQNLGEITNKLIPSVAKIADALVMLTGGMSSLAGKNSGTPSSEEDWVDQNTKGKWYAPHKRDYNSPLNRLRYAASPFGMQEWMDRASDKLNAKMLYLILKKDDGTTVAEKNIDDSSGALSVPIPGK